MSLGHVAIIGFGAIAQDLVDILGKTADAGLERLSVLVRESQVAGVEAFLQGQSIGYVDTLATSNLEAITANAPDVVVECAGHGAVGRYGPTVLARGSDLIVASVGALADCDLMDELKTAARGSGAQCIVPPGAIGGIDALGAAVLSGLRSVTYTGRKPPHAWLGTPAEGMTDLCALAEECVFFTGTAREAARSYPKNANVAATLALAGAGFDKTRVRLVADPGVVENVHEFKVASRALDFSVRLVGKPSRKNPKTSQSTVYSIARAVLNRRNAIVI